MLGYIYIICYIYIIITFVINRLNLSLFPTYLDLEPSGPASNYVLISHVYSLFKLLFQNWV